MSLDDSAGHPAGDPATDAPPPPRQPRPRGRKAEAAINDGLILQAAREVLTTAPDTPMAEIAARAHVGVGSLYRRFPSKEALTYRLCLDGMSTLADVARESLDDLRREDPWDVFVGFIHGAIEAGAGSLRGLAGTFVADDALNRVAVEMAALIQELLDRVQAAGAVRDDITANDVGLFFEMLRAIRVGDPARSDKLRARYIDLFAPGFRPAASKLRGSPPTWAEISGPWNP